MSDLVTLPILAGSAMRADLAADRLGDVRGKIVLVDGYLADIVGPRFAEWLLLRLFVDLGARYVDFVRLKARFWPVFVDAARDIGVADRIREVPADRLLVC